MAAPSSASAVGAPESAAATPRDAVRRRCGPLDPGQGRSAGAPAPSPAPSGQRCVTAPLPTDRADDDRDDRFAAARRWTAMRPGCRRRPAGPGRAGAGDRDAGRAGQAGRAKATAKAEPPPAKTAPTHRPRASRPVARRPHGQYRAPSQTRWGDRGCVGSAGRRSRRGGGPTPTRPGASRGGSRSERAAATAGSQRGSPPCRRPMSQPPLDNRLIPPADIPNVAPSNDRPRRPALRSRSGGPAARCAGCSDGAGVSRLPAD